MRNNIWKQTESIALSEAKASVTLILILLIENYFKSKLNINFDTRMKDIIDETR